jgi:hypothetical protein
MLLVAISSLFFGTLVDQQRKKPSTNIPSSADMHRYLH